MMLNVVCVDDEEMLRGLCKQMLEDQASDIKVTIFSNPKDAMEYLKTTEVDAIISDYAMEPEDGVTFLKKVRQMNPTMPFILFTGRSKESVVIFALNEGADYFLKKTSDGGVATYSVLEHMIRTSVERRRNEDIIQKLKAALSALPILPKD